MAPAISSQTRPPHRVRAQEPQRQDFRTTNGTHPPGMRHPADVGRLREPRDAPAGQTRWTEPWRGRKDKGREESSTEQRGERRSGGSRTSHWCGPRHPAPTLRCQGHPGPGEGEIAPLGPTAAVLGAAGVACRVRCPYRRGLPAGPVPGWQNWTSAEFEPRTGGLRYPAGEGGSGRGAQRGSPLLPARGATPCPLPPTGPHHPRAPSDL